MDFFDSFASKIKLGTIIFLLVGLSMAYFGYQKKKDLALVKKDGITVSGKILSGQLNHNRKSGRVTHSFSVEFSPKEGQKTSRSFKVEEAFFNSHVKGDSLINPIVQVRYLPTDFDNSIIVNGSANDSNTLMNVGLVFTVLSLSSLIVILATQGTTNFWKFSD